MPIQRDLGIDKIDTYLDYALLGKAADRLRCTIVKDKVLGKISYSGHFMILRLRATWYQWTLP